MINIFTATVKKRSSGREKEKEYYIDRQTETQRDRQRENREMDELMNKKITFFVLDAQRVTTAEHLENVTLAAHILQITNLHWRPLL